MTNRVVLDTSVLVALVDTRDKWHSAATAIKDLLKAGGVGLVYLDPVIRTSPALMGDLIGSRGYIASEDQTM